MVDMAKLHKDTDTVKYRQIKEFGGSAHVILPKETVGKWAKIMIDKWPSSPGCRDCVFYDFFWQGCVREGKGPQDIPHEGTCKYILTLKDIRAMSKIKDE